VVHRHEHPDAAPLRKLFREKYPEVNLTILRQPGEKIRTRILTEMRAGKFFWDVSRSTTSTSMRSRRKGCSPPTRPRRRAADFPGARSIRRALGGESTCAIRHRYNTRSVRGSRGAPKSWEDLLQPVWKEKFAMDESESNGTPPCSTISAGKRAAP